MNKDENTKNINNEEEDPILSNINKDENTGLTMANDARINLIVSNSDNVNEDAIVIGQVFHNMKMRVRVFIWIAILCIIAGILYPLLMYQFGREPVTVSSIVALNNEIMVDQGNETNLKGKTNDKSALDRQNQVDLYEITSPKIIRKALDRVNLSKTISYLGIQNNLNIQTEEQSDEEDNTDEAESRFIVTLTNGFFDTEQGAKGKKKTYLPDEELSLLLDRILTVYNEQLIRKYKSVTLPDDEISFVEKKKDETSFDYQCKAIKTALIHLKEYCDEQPEEVKAYYSLNNRRTLNDWIGIIQIAQEYADEVESHIMTAGLSENNITETGNLQYELINTQIALRTVEEKINSNKKTLNNYTFSKTYVISQDNEVIGTTGKVTDDYNDLVMQQVKLFREAAELRIQVANLQEKQSITEKGANKQNTDYIRDELDDLLTATRYIQDGIRDYMTEIEDSYNCANLIIYSYPQGESVSIVQFAAKKIIVGSLLGIVFACFIWFIMGLIPEFRREKRMVLNNNGRDENRGDEKK